MNATSAGGIDDLRDLPGRGGKPTMTPRQEKALGKALERSPRKAGINSNLWTGRAAQKYLAKQGWWDYKLISSLDALNMTAIFFFAHFVCRN